MGHWELKVDPTIQSESPEFIAQLKSKISKAKDTLAQLETALKLTQGLDFETLGYVTECLNPESSELDLDISGHLDAIRDNHAALTTLFTSWDAMNS